MAKIEITQELVREYFDYRDGSLYWKKKYFRSGLIKIGDKAGSITKFRQEIRNRIQVLGKRYMASRLIFLWHKGYIPDVVDHEDRNTLNDRIENLREVTRSENGKNRTSARNLTSIYLGVHFCNSKKLWVSSIKTNKARKTIGRFMFEKEAALSYNREAVRWHKEFANLNIIQP